MCVTALPETEKIWPQKQIKTPSGAPIKLVFAHELFQRGQIVKVLPDFSK